MVNAVGGGPQPTPVKKPEEKKEEKKPESQAPAPSPAPAEKPNAGNAGSADVNAPKDGLDPKAAFAVSQRLQTKTTGDQKPVEKKASNDETGDGAGNASGTEEDDRTGDVVGKMHPEGKEEPIENGPGGTSVGGGERGKDDPKPDKPDKPEEPEKMTTRRALDILIEDGNDGLKRLDVAKDKIERGKEDPGTDEKISTDDLDAAIGKDGYLTDEQKEAATHLRDSGAWDEINGGDSKGTFKEIMEYRNNRTSPDETDGQRPEGTGQDKVDSDGKIGAFEQGDTNDCWWLTSVVAVNNTEEGKDIIKDSIKQNDDGSYAVNFKGDKSGKTYTVTEEMVEKNKNSKGDDDVKILEEAARQYFNDNPDDLDGQNPVKNGGLNSYGVRLLTGKESESTSGSGLDTLDTGRDTAEEKDNFERDGKVSTEDLDAADDLSGLSDEAKDSAKFLRESDAWDDINGGDDKATIEEIVDYRKNSDDEEVNKHIDNLMGDKYKDNYKSNREMVEEFKNNPGKGMMTFSSAPSHDSAKQGAAKNGHAFTVLGIDGDTVTYINPYDSDKERTMSVDDLLKADNMYYASM